MEYTTAALVGAAGGAGATRLTVEVGATLARDGRDVALLDAAYATQGLSQHVPGRIDPDLTAVVTDDDRTLEEGLVALDAPVGEDGGRLAACPAFAPFTRLAAAKTETAARALQAWVETAADGFDHVLVDTPPVAANQAVAAVTGVDRVALVAPATERGVDALQRARGSLADLGVDPPLLVANRSAAGFPDADVAVPESAATDVPETPACLADPNGQFAERVAALAEALFEVDLDVEFEREGVAAEVTEFVRELR